MIHYTVKKLALMAGVSIRTLHLYDRMKLLVPSLRTQAGYRLYGEKELLRLQQILFYRELDIPLAEIRQILDQPHFDTVASLESHKKALTARLERMKKLIKTVDKTIFNLKEGIMLKHEELYDGLSRAQAEAYRNEVIEKWGEDVVEKSEQQLRSMSKSELHQLKEDFIALNRQLEACKGLAPEEEEVQRLIARHYQFISHFWGSNPSAEAYTGLGELYVNDDRYTMNDGAPDPGFAAFLREAMARFAVRLSC